MIDDRNEYERTKAWLKANQVSSDNSVFNDHRHAIVASSDPYGLFAEVISEGMEYHYCNGELHFIYDEKAHSSFWHLLGNPYL